MTRLARPALLLGAAVALLAAAPGRAGKKEDILQADVDEIQRQVFDLKRLLEKQGEDMQRLLAVLESGPDARKQMADFNANVDALRGEIHALSSRFDSTAERLGALERRVSQTCRMETAASTTPGGEPPAAGDAAALPAPAASAATTGGGAAGDPAQAAFQRAYGDYIKDSFDLAVSEFREFLDHYPDSDLADNAQYWIAMCAFNQRKYEDALREFDRLLTRYPAAENAPEALYRKALALLELNRLGQAVLVFNDVVAKYPDTPPAKQASERLRELAAGER